MIIAIDGPRSSGKTFFVAELVIALNNAGFKAHKFKDERGDGENLMRRMISIITDNSSRNEIVVLDRFNLTEFVMSTALKRRPYRQLLRETKAIDDVLFLNRGLSYVLLPSVETLTARTEARTDGKTFDIPPDRAHVLWTHAATAVSSHTKIFPNETYIDQQHHIKDIIRDVHGRGVWKR